MYGNFYMEGGGVWWAAAVDYKNVVYFGNVGTMVLLCASECERLLPMPHLIVGRSCRFSGKYLAPASFTFVFCKMSAGFTQAVLRIWTRKDPN